MEFDLEEGSDGVFLDSASGLRVNRVKVSPSNFDHDCPKYFDPSAHCKGFREDGCNVSSQLAAVFDMFAYEEEFYFMK